MKVYYKYVGQFLGPIQQFALDMIAANPRVSTGDIALELGVTHQAVGLVVHKLIDKGLIDCEWENGGMKKRSMKAVF